MRVGRDPVWGEGGERGGARFESRVVLYIKKEGCIIKYKLPEMLC